MSELRTWPTSYGPIVQRKIYANLFTEIIRQNKCVLCAACMAVCPTNAIVILGETPRLTGVCIKCGYCYYACPSTTDETFSGFSEELSRVETRVFGVEREEVFGVYRKILVVKEVEDPLATVEEGVIRRLMMFGLDKGYFDVVGFPGYGEPVTKYMLMPPRGKWEAAASIARSSEELSRVRLKPLTPGLTYNSVRGAFEELIGGFFYGVDPLRVAVFGPPQHIRSVWRMRFSWSEHKKLSKTIVFTASYFYRPVYAYKDLKTLLANKGVNLDMVEDWVFHPDGIEFIVDGNSVKFSYSELDSAIYKGFRTIFDPTGEFADISVGLLNNVDGVVIIARSEEGVKLLDEAIGDGVLEPVDFDLDVVLDGLRGLYGGG